MWCFWLISTLPLWGGLSAVFLFGREYNSLKSCLNSEVIYQTSASDYLRIFSSPSSLHSHQIRGSRSSGIKHIFTVAETWMCFHSIEIYLLRTLLERRLFSVYASEYAINLVSELTSPCETYVLTLWRMLNEPNISFPHGIFQFTGKELQIQNTLKESHNRITHERSTCYLKGAKGTVYSGAKYGWLWCRNMDSCSNMARVPWNLIVTTKNTS